MIPCIHCSIIFPNFGALLRRDSHPSNDTPPPTLQSPSSPCRRSSQRWGRRPTKNEGWNHEKCSLDHEKMGFTTKHKYITKLWISTCDRQCLARLGHWRHSPPWKLGTICPSMLGLRSEASMKAHWNLRDGTKSSKQKSTWKASQTPSKSLASPIETGCTKGILQVTRITWKLSLWPSKHLWFPWILCPKNGRVIPNVPAQLLLLWGYSHEHRRK